MKTKTFKFFKRILKLKEQGYYVYPVLEELFMYLIKIKKYKIKNIGDKKLLWYRFELGSLSDEREKFYILEKGGEVKCQ